ncbi:MAG: DegV family protein [Terrisporobacter othiniensis]|uniref:DegV family protein n=2 Tax=Terrisporobacter TaxID=1505652 RepID=A0AAX2ZEJ7_9FIRM|nr:MULTISPECIES: DegV family protein [Terrisporobacter]MBN9646562.1 DegV family protein [Terrisporobacter glycolicus]MDU4859501.1 DegV family protein [Terrisporobacter othiniensis]MDU6993888.1 DegV family protein [Terrisporobacter othiniensis]UEL46785.1 DegV family protein [Terrisporobacter hibernicus]HBI91465.1 DegV family protein [Terrisporobacter hibernicus]
MKNIKLITDGSCDLSKEIIESSKVEIVDVMVSFGDKSYSTRTDITIPEFYEMMKDYSELPKTSCPSPNQFLDAFDCEEDNIIVLCLTSKLSGIYNSAVLAKNMYEEENESKKRIEIIDSTTGSIGQALLVSKIANMIDEDKSMDEIVKTIEKLKHELVFYGALHTLENAIKGGRINALAGKIIGALNLKAIVHITDGLVKPMDKARGDKNSINKVIDYIKNNVNKTSGTKLAIGHANCPERAMKVKEVLENYHDFKEVYVMEIGPSMGVYTSEGAVLVAVI